MKHDIDYVEQLVAKGGPTIAEYYELDAWISEMHELWTNGTIGANELCTIISTFGEAF